MPLISSYLVQGTLAARPAAAVNGRLYLATDVKKVYHDNGVSWDDWTAGVPEVTLAAAPGAGGNFSIAHGLAVAPSRISILMTSGGAIWAQTPAVDAVNVNLIASDAGVTATIYVFA